MLTVCIPTASVACSYPEPPAFSEEVASAKSIAVVYVEAQRSISESQNGHVFPFIEADVRVVENLQGVPAKIRSIKYQSHWCGGHTLHVSRYYVVLLRENREVLRLGASASTVLWLGDEYDESRGSKGSLSRLLLELRNFENIGSVVEGFNPEPFLAPVRTQMDWPSSRGMN